MKEYRAKLKRQIIWMTAGILFSCMVIVICCVSAVQLGADEHEASFMRGFQSGLLHQSVRTSDSSHCGGIFQHDRVCGADWSCDLCQCGGTGSKDLVP